MPAIGTWNMQGANDGKWLMIKTYMLGTGADAICLQECGAIPSTAVQQPAVVAISNPPGGGPVVVQPYTWNVGTTSRPKPLYILLYNFGATPGARCNLAVVTSAPPAAWWLVWAAYGPTWRPSVGATLQGGVAAVFSVHAISPGGVDGPAVVGAIASLASNPGGGVPAPGSWYVGGDFNRVPATWAGQAIISLPDGPTYSTSQPVSVYDYVISSVNVNANQAGQRANESAQWSDHFAVHYDTLA